LAAAAVAASSLAFWALASASPAGRAFFGAAAGFLAASASGLEAGASLGSSIFAGTPGIANLPLLGAAAGLASFTTGAALEALLVAAGADGASRVGATAESTRPATEAAPKPSTAVKDLAWVSVNSNPPTAEAA